MADIRDLGRTRSAAAGLAALASAAGACGLPGTTSQAAQGAGPAAPARAGTTERVSVGVGGAQANGVSQAPSLSADGRYVAFDSLATNLVGGDTNGASDVFVRDRATGKIERVSVGPGGTQANGDSGLGRISADGRFVVFASNAPNLVPDDANGLGDVFVRDRQLGTTERVSLRPDGREFDSFTMAAAISADGRAVAFSAEGQIFVRDRGAGTTTLASVADDGTPANDGCLQPAISADGRYVGFASFATNLAPGAGGNFAGVFVRDRRAGTTTLASVGLHGAPADSASWWPSLSADGRHIAFASLARNLVAGDTNNRADVFVRDLPAGATRRVSVRTGGGQVGAESNFPAISADGRAVAFTSKAARLVPGDTNRQPDVFVRDVAAGTTERVSVSSGGAQADAPSSFPAISADGRVVGFSSAATGLVPGDTNGTEDAFVRVR